MGGWYTVLEYQSTPHPTQIELGFIRMHNINIILCLSTHLAIHLWFTPRIYRNDQRQQWEKKNCKICHFFVLQNHIGAVIRSFVPPTPTPTPTPRNCPRKLPCKTNRESVGGKVRNSRFFCIKIIELFRTRKTQYWTISSVDVQYL